LNRPTRSRATGGWRRHTPRLQAAQALLFTADSIETIAAESGFANRFYFSRVFMRHMGVSPAIYRKAVRV